MENGVRLAMDVMYVQSIMFLVTTSIGIGLITVSYLPTRQKKDLYSALDSVLRLYNKQSLKIKEITADQEFKFAKDVLTNMDINFVPVLAGKHQPHVERTIRTLKEHYRSMYHQLPFKSMPRLMIVKGAQECARWLNSFPSEHGYQNISPRTLITGVELDYRIHCQHSFGSYVQTHQETRLKT